MIRTVHGRGYLFLASVVVRDARSSSHHDIRYAHNGAVNIAYEVTGDGPVESSTLRQAP